MALLARRALAGALLGLGCWSCSAENPESQEPGGQSGGAATGAAATTGGLPVDAGTGGTGAGQGQGGTPTGGAVAGGTATGGAATGGVAAGGTPAGGTATGGAAIGGGAGTGGGAGIGGTGTGGGGTPTGGVATGGVATGGGATGGVATGGTGGADPIAALEEYLQIPRATRPALADQSFATVPLSVEQAERARTLLWEDHVQLIEEERRAEHDAKSITLGDATLRYDFIVFGNAPADGRSLWLSLHGGGEADPSVNDEQWANQLQLYQPDEGIYLCPRAPTDTWNLWHQDHIDPLFERLIENFVALEGIDPNRVYVMGYSAGGDGVYQLGPRMADHWAAAAAMAGHPNDAQPLSLRNIGFTIHVGELDTAYDRNLVAVEWQTQLEQLQADDPEGYVHHVEVHPGMPHWMDLQDAVAVPWMAAFTRNPVPDRVVWYQDDITHSRFYWLADPNPTRETLVVAQLVNQTVEIDSADVSPVVVRLRDDMLDLDQPVTVMLNGGAVFEGIVPRTILTLHETLSERGDPELVFSGEVVAGQ